jgi:hypothetical protein
MSRFKEVRRIGFEMALADAAPVSPVKQSDLVNESAKRAVFGHFTP